MASKSHWSRAALERQGFQGWLSFKRLADELPTVSREGGVYVVQGRGSAPAFLDANPGGRFKGRDPTVSREALEANWVEGAEVVYIGKADQLQRRLREFMRFGAGTPVGHWGGRLIWQLARSNELLIAWRETPGAVPKVVESEMIDAFRNVYGKPPFANEPHRLGR
jgi:hypothetical protein